MSLYDSRILLVDDEEDLLKMVSGVLRDAGYKNVETAGEASMADFKYQNNMYHLVLLDVMLPDTDGFTLFQKWISDGKDVPVIFLSARDEDRARLRGLGLGADDYITKPFLMEELLLRVKAVLKRTRHLPEEHTTIKIGTAEVNFGEGIIYKKGEPISLTAKEMELLQKLYENRGRIVSMNALMDTLWPDGSYGLENSLMVHVRRLREKLEENPSRPEYLLTVRGLGYRLKK